MTIYKPHLKNLRIGMIYGSPDASSSLQLDDTTTGFLPNRLTTTQQNAIASPAAGLMIYNTTTSTLNFYNGSAWTNCIGIDSVSQDTSPVLGGNLNVSTFSIISSSNGNITIAPNGTGTVIVGGTAPTIATAAATDLFIAPGTTGSVKIGGTTPTLTTAAATNLTLSPGTTGLVAFGNAASFTANGAEAASLGSTGVTGHGTVLKWLTVKDGSGTTYYIPCF